MDEDDVTVDVYVYVVMMMMMWTIMIFYATFSSQITREYTYNNQEFINDGISIWGVTVINNSHTQPRVNLETYIPYALSCVDLS